MGDFIDQMRQSTLKLMNLRADLIITILSLPLTFPQMTKRIPNFMTGKFEIILY